MGNARGNGDEWAELQYGEAVSRRLWGTRLEGLIWNRAAPDELLVRLLDTYPGLLWRRDLSDTVRDAAVDHPEWTVRARLAETGTVRACPRGSGPGCCSASRRNAGATCCCGPPPTHGRP